MPSPLPDNPFPINLFRIAYNKCLHLEAEAPTVEGVKNCPPPIVCARLLGHLLRLAPTGNAQEQIQREISAARDHAALMQVAAVYVNHFIRALKRSSGPTPVPSEHSSRPSFEDAREYAMAMMEECRLDHRSARALAARRDDDRCMLTQLKRFDPHGEGWGTFVQAAHIIPESTNKNISADDRNRFKSGGVWAILSMFTSDTIVEDLAGNRIHRLENILSINIAAHACFDDLLLWLEPIEGSPHEYRVCLASETMRLQPELPATVKFSTSTELPLPNPEYLALHALCSRVAWMSGAAEYLMDIERRMDDTNVLASDGSNVDLLMMALSIVPAC